MRAYINFTIYVILRWFEANDIIKLAKLTLCMLIMGYDDILQNAIWLNRGKNKIFYSLREQINALDSACNLDNEVSAIAKSYIYLGSELSTQIIKCLNSKDILIASLSQRPLLELMINSKYIFNHPKHQHDIDYMKRVCKDLFKKANARGKVKHSVIDKKSIYDRAKETKLKSFYENNYRWLSNWNHIMLKTMFFLDKEKERKVMISTLKHTLCLSIDIFKNISRGLKLSLNNNFVKHIEDFRDKY